MVMIRQFDAVAGWKNGFLSCAHWLSWRTGIDLGACREKVRVARALARLPQIGAALERGALSYAKVRALTRVATQKRNVNCWTRPAPARPHRWNGWSARGAGSIGWRTPLTPDASICTGSSTRGSMMTACS